MRGADFTGALDCVDDFPTVDPPDAGTALSSNSKTGDASGYWCEFDPAYLNADCHGANRPPADCAPSVAMCLKRSTRTGGCNAIAHTIRCRSLEAAFLAGDLAAPEVRREGCQPCVLLPFEAVPSDCPGEVLAEPARSDRDEGDRVLAARADFAVNENICAPSSDGSLSDRCLALIACADPTPGRITWSSTHFSQHAAVNSPVIVSVRDIPVEVRDGGFRFRDGAIGPTVDMLPYPTSPAGQFGYAMARFGNVDPADARLDSVTELVGLYGECMFTRAPQFRLRVRELWPDDPQDRAAIERYFGSSSLDWWWALDPATEWEARTVARGLGYWPELTEEQRADRAERLTTEVDCNLDLPVWCRWTPTRAGYFEITGAAAWISTRWNRGGRAVLSDLGASRIDDHLSDPDNREALAARMREWGADTPARLERMAGELGLRNDLTAVLPRENLRSDGRYAGSESRFSCGGTDVRILCRTGSGTFGNYTETHPVGVMVHDVRVATRAPGGR